MSGITAASCAVPAVWNGPSAGLIHRWPMDDSHVGGGKVLDVIGGLHGTISGGVTSGSGPKAVDTARVFDGASGVVTLPSMPLPAAPYSVFFKASCVSGFAGFPRILTWSLDATHSCILALNNTGALTIIPNAPDTQGVATLTSPWAQPGWHDGGFTWDGVTLTAYVDGVVVGTTSNTGFSYNVGEYAFGYKNGGAYFNGSLKEVVVYNRVVSAPEAAQIRSASLLSSGIPGGYSKVWQENFASLSLRTGGPTPAGFAAGTGIWASVGWDWNTGYGPDAMGKVQDITLYMSNDYNWRAVDASYPPLGQLDITTGGLVLIGSTPSAPISTAIAGTVGNYGTSQPYYCGGLLTTLYSMSIKPPYYRETVMQPAGQAHSWPATWSLWKRAQVADPEVEVDDFEIMEGGPFIARATLHTNNGNPGTGWLAPVDLSLAAHTFGVWVTATQVTFYLDGEAYWQVAVPNGIDPTAYAHFHCLDQAVGFSWNGYPASISGPQLTTVRSVTYYAPASNTSGVFPASPPVPAITWRAGFSGGNIPVATGSGGTVADLSGGASYSVIGTSSLVVSGTQLKTSGALSAGPLPFYIRALDADGVPGIAPKISATVA